MSSKGLVFFNDGFAGTLKKQDNEFVFTYDPAYRMDKTKPPLSLSFPKSTAVFRSPFLFPFFFGLLAEGADKALQCAILKIDENDHFTRLLKTTGINTIGAVTVRESP